MNSQGGTDAAQKGGPGGIVINTGHDMTPSSSNQFGGLPSEYMQYDQWQRPPSRQKEPN